MMQEKMINGVDVERLSETIDVIKSDPSIASFRFRATNRWESGGHNRTKIHDFYGAGENNLHLKDFQIDADEPTILLGEDLGANPVEYALSALAGCLTTTLVYHAAAQGITIDEVESTLEGDLDLRGFLNMSDDIRRGYNNIQVSFRVKGDATQEKLGELVELAKKCSPVYDIITGRTQVTVTAELMPEQVH